MGRNLKKRIERISPLDLSLQPQPLRISKRELKVLMAFTGGILGVGSGISKRELKVLTVGELKMDLIAGESQKEN